VENCLWKFEDFEKLAQIPDPEVRGWTCRRIADLYEDKGLSILKKLIEDEEKSVVFEALSSIKNFDDKSLAPEVLNIFKNSRGLILGIAANVLGEMKEPKFVRACKEKMHEGKLSFIEKNACLNALGYFRDRESFELLFQEFDNAIRCSDLSVCKVIVKLLFNFTGGLEIILQRLSICSKSLVVEILSDLMTCAGLDFPTNQLRPILESNKNPFPRQTKSFLRDNFGEGVSEDFTVFLRRKKYSEVVELMVDAAEKRLAESRAKFEDVPDPELFESFRLLLGFRSFLRSGNTDLSRNLAIISVMLISKFVEQIDLSSLNVDQCDDELLFSILFQDRSSYAIDFKIIDTLHNRCAKAIIFHNAHLQIKKKPESTGSARAIILLKGLKSADTIPVLLDWLENTQGEFVTRDCDDALKYMGSRLIDYLISNYEKLSDFQKVHLLTVLKGISLEETVDFLLHHWSDLWDKDKQIFIETLELIGSERFIAPLRHELKPGEVSEARCYYLLCRIHAIEDPILDELEETLAISRDCFCDLSFSDSDLESILSEPLKVELKCNKCQKNYFYEIERISLDGKEPIIGDSIVCKNCRAINQYKITVKGKAAIALYLSYIFMEREDGKKIDLDKCPVKIFNSGMMDVGKMPIEEIEASYRKKLEEMPDDPGIRIGYANVLMNRGKELESVYQFRQALKLDPHSAEAFGGLGNYEFLKENYKQSYEYFKQAYKYMNTCKFYRSTSPEALKESIVEELRKIEEILADDGAGAAKNYVFVETAEVGRNDPCPCGSGKKYKKCCLDKIKH